MATLSPLFMKFFCLAALLLPALAFAQNADSKVNLFKNGNFEQFTTEEDLWDGVDASGCLAGDTSQNELKFPGGVERPRGMFYRRETGQWDAVQEGGNVGGLAMPISVQVADLNRDGLLDIFTLDAAGYARVYFNSGTPKEPKFTQGEIVPLCMQQFVGLTANDKTMSAEGGLKACLGDLDKSGKLDILMGSYLGRLFWIKNTGSPSAPEWKQPDNLASITIPTTRDGRLWANLLAPAVYDWNKDGKPDVLVGEGSYSANAVHLLLNVNSGGMGAKPGPQFSEDAREYLAYGDGREQLIPAVVDYNGDGYPDLRVGDRLGHIWVYLSDGPYKKGAELKRMENPISFGDVTEVGSGNNGTGCVFPAVGDLNGDGKFDIIVGKSNGHIAVSYNIGTATEPKFGPLVDIKGEKLYKSGSMREPKDWMTTFGHKRGNLNAYATVITAQEDPEAASPTSRQVLKFGYHPILNKVIRKPALFIPGSDNAFVMPSSYFINKTTVFAERLGWDMPDSNIAILRQNINAGLLKPNTNYTLSFKVKGRGVKNGQASFVFAGWLIRDSGKGSTPENTATETMMQEVSFGVTSTWTTVSKQMNFKFQKAELNDPAKWSQGNSQLEYRGILDIRAPISVDTGALYIDDVQLKPM